MAVGIEEKVATSEYTGDCRVREDILSPTYSAYGVDEQTEKYLCSCLRGKTRIMVDFESACNNELSEIPPDKVRMVTLVGVATCEFFMTYMNDTDGWVLWATVVGSEDGTLYDEYKFCIATDIERPATQRETVQLVMLAVCEWLLRE